MDRLIPNKINKFSYKCQLITKLRKYLKNSTNIIKSFIKKFIKKKTSYKFTN